VQYVGSPGADFSVLSSKYESELCAFRFPISLFHITMQEEDYQMIRRDQGYVGFSWLCFTKLMYYETQIHVLNESIN